MLFLRLWHGNRIPSRVATCSSRSRGGEERDALAGYLPTLGTYPASLSHLRADSPFPARQNRERWFHRGRMGERSQSVTCFLTHLFIFSFFSLFSFSRSSHSSFSAFSPSSQLSRYPISYLPIFPFSHIRERADIRQQQITRQIRHSRPKHREQGHTEQGIFNRE